MGVGRLVRVVAGGAEHQTAVLAAIWPTLVLPVATITGLPPDTLRAILVHQFAATSRHDLVNIIQMFIESLLFFNPAVWWIGRQVRLEREACCDATAVRLTGRPIEYSRSLAVGEGRRGRGRRRSQWPGRTIAGPATSAGSRPTRLEFGSWPAVQISFTGLLTLLRRAASAPGALEQDDRRRALAAQALSRPSVCGADQGRTSRICTAEGSTRGGTATLKGVVQISGGGPAPVRSISTTRRPRATDRPWDRSTRSGPI